MKATHPVLFVLVTLGLGLTGLAAGASALAQQLPALAPPSPTRAPLFFSTISSNSGDQIQIQTAADERAMISIASLKCDVPRDTWAQAGWQIGTEIGVSEEVPLDCVLHARQGTVRQLYAQCRGGTKIAVPSAGADYIYVLLYDGQHTVKKMLQFGKLYNLDTTGLIP